MRFADPWILILLPVAWLMFFIYRNRPHGRLTFSNLSLILQAAAGPAIDPNRVLLILRAVAISFFVIALARPQAGKRFTEITSEGVDIMLALDTSGSMQALDLKLDGSPVPRVDVVKKEAGDFIDMSPNDRLGIVIFGENAFVQCPLTMDHNILLKLLGDVKLGMAGDSTAIGDAIGVAVNHMKDLKAKSKVLVLLTDGQSSSGIIPPLKAAEIAKNYQIKIYTIGVGTDGQAPFLVDTPLGKRVVYQRADLDEETLKKISALTGGIFYRAKDTDTLKRVYGEINRLEKTEVKTKEYNEYTELYARFVSLGLLLLLVEFALTQTLFRKVP
jgi:Ca-activated chloride channel family protein